MYNIFQLAYCKYDVKKGYLSSVYQKQYDLLEDQCEKSNAHPNACF